MERVQLLIKVVSFSGSPVQGQAERLGFDGKKSVHRVCHWPGGPTRGFESQRLTVLGFWLIISLAAVRNDTGVGTGKWATRRLAGPEYSVRKVDDSNQQ